jgi:ATP-dependent DNA helicase RecG
VPEATLADLDLQRINELVLLINQGQPRPIETIKSSVEEAVPFLEKKRFLLRTGEITTLGMLVCGSHPADHLLFRCQLDCFVHVPNVVAQDKKTFRDTILSLMEAAQGWTLRNIMTGVSIEGGGSLLPEYPDKLIRESVNNALAHRDYALDRPVQITLKPRQSLLIRNPGQLPHEIVFECPADDIPVRRIFPNPRARNPRLADILKLHNKWEGKGIGMADLVNFALSNQTDVPYYLFHSPDELSLCITAGRTLDDETKLWFDLMDGLILKRTGGRALTSEHQTVLAYLMKSELANRRGLYTLALTPGNNHFAVLEDLKSWKLVELHPGSDRFREVFIVCRDLMTRDLTSELRKLYGVDFDTLNALSQALLNAIALAENYSRSGGLNARAAGRVMRILRPAEFKAREEESFFRAVRKATETLAPALTEEPDVGKWIQAPDKMLQRQGTSTRPLFRLNREFQKSLF